MKSIRERMGAAIRRIVLWGEHRVPPGVRSCVGVLCMIGGVFGFLPIVGFWMIPAGLALIALDIPPLRRRLLAWARSDTNPDADAGSRTTDREPQRHVRSDR